MAEYRGVCRSCGGALEWWACPTGGWWSHLVHPADNHDADLPDLPQEMDDAGYWHTVSGTDA